MLETKIILNKRLEKLEKHFVAIREYHAHIKMMEKEHDFYKPEVFTTLKVEERAILEAFLKRFSSIQDYLGSKIFPLLLEVRGIPVQKMSEVLDKVEKEEIIDSLDHWIELREVRNDLEHDYPDELADALNDIRYCVDHLSLLESYYKASLRFLEGQLP